MRFSEKSLENLLKVNRRAGYKKEVDRIDQYFEHPIIHREIHGDRIFIPLNIERVWNRIG